MAQSYNAQNVKIAPHDAFYEAAEAVCVDLAGKLPADLDGTYFSVYGEDNTQYAVWFDVDDLSTAPTVAGATLVEVDIATGDNASAIAAALAAATVGSYTLTQVDEQVLFVNGNNDEVANDAADGTTGAPVDVITKGGNVYLGLIDGDITITPSSSKFDITSHQTGTSIIGQIYQGFDAAVELTLLECTKKIYDAMIKLSGGATFTPSGGTEVAGYGTGQIGSSALLRSRTLRLHPVSKISTDLSEDWYFWKASPEVGGITISGENPQTLPVTFTAYPDTTKQEVIDIFVKGDGSQAGLNK